MPRVKGSNIHKNRRKKILKLAKGYFGSKHKLYKTAKEQVMHSLKYAYRDRKQNKREMRKLWITRINAACRMNEISYSKFISGLNKAGIEINRKMLSENYVSLNDFYYALNLEGIKTGSQIGWNVSQGFIELYYSAALAENDEPCIVIDFETSPYYDFDKFA